jgi:GH24 family phage-related lysozyme (muramidase)
MHPSVRNVFFDFSKQFEGALHFMYLDIKNLVTTGVGNLIDPVGLALPLPWTDKDSGAAADAGTITAEWNNVKSRTDLSPLGGGAFESITSLRLSDDAVANLVDGKLSQNETTLLMTPEFGGFASWPADAQLGLLSMAWAMGPAFAQAGHWPTFRADCAASDFAKAATDSRMAEAGNPGLIPRNQAEEMLFLFASRVQAQGLPVDQLIYPRILTTGGAVLDMGLPSPGAKWPVLKQGNSSQAVTVLQTLLFGAGSASVTGTFDAATTAAVKTFQSTHKDRDGIRS